MTNRTNNRFQSKVNYAVFSFLGCKDLISKLYVYICMAKLFWSVIEILFN